MISQPFNNGDVLLAEESYGADISRGSTYTCKDCWSSHGVWYVTVKERPELTWKASRFVKKTT